MQAKAYSERACHWADAERSSKQIADPWLVASSEAAYRSLELRLVEATA